MQTAPGLDEATLSWRPGPEAALPLETLVLEGLPEHAIAAFEAALSQVCISVALILEEATGAWRLKACANSAEERSGFSTHALSPPRRAAFRPRRTCVG
jgi:hypothetical protein